MNIINTTAPLSIEQIKLAFSGEPVKYIIDYKNSPKLQGQKLLTYLSNLKLDCDIAIENATDAEFLDLLKTYLHSSTIVTVPILERAVTQMLLEIKGLLPSSDFAEFAAENKEIIAHWMCCLDSLVLYNTYMINDEEFKAEAMSYPEDAIETTDGINWISLIKNEYFFIYYQAINPANLRYHSSYWTKNMFKGKNLYAYWANENNPMFLITWGILEQKINSNEWNKLLADAEREIKENKDATPV